MKQPMKMPSRIQAYLRTKEKVPTSIAKFLKKPKGVFYNSQKALCSIYSSGVMCYDILKNSAMYDLIYSEQQGGLIDYSSDFLVVNYHPAVCNWISQNNLKKYKGKTFCIVTEIGLYSNDLAPVNPKIFDHYLLIDPTIPETGNMHAFPRPLIPCHVPLHVPTEVPIIGSFGFATPGKNWEQIIDMVHEEFEQAILRINIPKATHVPEHIQNDIIQNEVIRPAKKLETKPGIQFELTFHTFETQQDIVNWCAQNTINVFLYNRSNATGLSAVTDQAIIAERPLLVSCHPTFRHIHPYIECSSNISIQDAIRTSLPGVMKMKTNWSGQNFVKKFETLFKKV